MNLPPSDASEPGFMPSRSRRGSRHRAFTSRHTPGAVGFGVGVLSAIMGVGGGFIMVPAMIYVLGIPTKVVIGTSLFQIIFVAGFTTMIHASTNYSVDVVLALFLLLGGVLGAQFGTQIGARLKAEQLRILLALLVMGVAGKIGFDLLLPPGEIFSLAEPGGYDVFDPQHTTITTLEFATINRQATRIRKVTVSCIFTCP